MSRRRTLLLLLLATPVVLLVALLAAFRLAAGARESESRTTAAPSTGRFVSAAGLDLFVQEAGPADGPAVFLVHGTGAWSAIWRETMDALAGAGYHAVAIDLPPFGFSQRPQPPSYSDSAQAGRINGVMDAMGLTGVTLVGHSIGARPTVEAVLRDPARVRLLVLVDAALDPAPAGGQPTGAGWLTRTVLSAGWIRNPLIATSATNPLLTRWLLRKLIYDPADATDAQVKMVQRQFRLAGTTPAVGSWFAAMLLDTAPPLNRDAARYSALVMPALLIWGREDSITPLPRGEALEHLLPHATLAILEKTGHIPAMENAPAFNAALLGFLAAHPPEPR